MNTATEAIVTMVNRDLVRSCRQLEGQRPGQPIADKAECVVRVPVTRECWTQVYRAEPPVEGDVVFIQARFAWNAGKRAWQLVYWHGVAAEPTEATYGRVPADRPFTEAVYEAWGRPWLPIEGATT